MPTLHSASAVSPTSTSSALRRKQTKKKGVAPKEASSSSSADATSPSSADSASSPLSKQEESIERMRGNLSRFARVSNKRMAIRSLQECAYLKSIPMETSPTAPTQRDEWQLLEQDVQQTNVLLNGLMFHGSASNQVLKVLRALCQELCKGLRLSSESIYIALLVRLASTTNGADSYFQLNSLLGSQDLVLQPQPERNAGDLPPTDLSLYEAHGQVHAVITAYTSYGLFRRSDVKTGKPWIALLAQVHERINLSSGVSVRQVQAQITTPE